MTFKGKKEIMFKERSKWPAHFRGRLRPEVCCKSSRLGTHAGQSIPWAGEMRWRGENHSAAGNQPS